MKTIEEIIRSNRDIWDNREPEAGHFDRFSVKLELRRQARTAKRSIVPYLLRAAVVTLLVTLSSLWTWDHFIRPGSSRMTLGQVSPQYKEVENYYLHQVNLMEDEIVNTDLQDTEQKQMLIGELKSMDSVYVSLQKELKANPNDERIISAMIEHYQTKLEVMTYIVDQLKEIRNNNTNNENNEKVTL
jgi:hypothetical protein